MTNGVCCPDPTNRDFVGANCRCCGIPLTRPEGTRLVYCDRREQDPVPCPHCQRDCCGPHTGANRRYCEREHCGAACDPIGVCPDGHAPI